MLYQNEEVEILVENELSPKAQETSSETNTKQKDKQKKKKEYLNLNGYENLNF